MARRAGEALSEHLGAVQGQDKHGSTAMVWSVACVDHSLGIGGIATNFKFSRIFMERPQSRLALKNLIHCFMEMGCFEIQINVVGKEELLEAQKHPEKYRTLMVRVAGFSE